VIAKKDFQKKKPHDCEQAVSFPSACRDGTWESNRFQVQDQENGYWQTSYAYFLIEFSSKPLDIDK
jgi:hypothetical protein